MDTAVPFISAHSEVDEREVGDGSVLDGDAAIGAADDGPWHPREARTQLQRDTARFSARVRFTWSSFDQHVFFVIYISWTDHL